MSNIPVFLPTGVQNPGFGRVHTNSLNPGFCQVHTTPLNPDLSRVHTLLLCCDRWLARPRVHPNFFIHLSIPSCPLYRLSVFITHRAQWFRGRMCGYWVLPLAMSRYDLWYTGIVGLFCGGGGGGYMFPLIWVPCVTFVRTARRTESLSAEIIGWAV